MKKIKQTIKKIEFKDIVIFLIPLITYLIILSIFFPGILSYDSFSQLNQITSNQFNNWHPFLHTFIEKICIKIWNTPASVCLLQILVFSIIWTVICRYNRKNDNNKIFIFQIIVTLFIVLNPLNSFYSITLWKDILYSYFFLLFCFLVEILIDKNFNVPSKFYIFFGIIAAIISELRHNGFYAIIIFLIILFFIFLKKKKWKFYFLIIITMVISMSLFYGLEIVYNVKQLHMSLTDVKIIHSLAYYNEKSLLTDEDKRIISNIIPLDDMQDNFNIYYSDGLSAKLDSNNLTKYKSDIFKIFIRISTNHLIYFLKYILNSSNMTWCIIRPDDAIGNLIYFQLEDSPNNVNKIYPIHQNDKVFKSTQNIVIKSMYENKFLQTIFYSPSLYMYLSFLIMILLIVKYKKTFNYLLVIFPNIFNILIVMASTPIQDIRYIYPNFLIFYLLLIILIKSLLEKKMQI